MTTPTPTLTTRVCLSLISSECEDKLELISRVEERLYGCCCCGRCRSSERDWTQKRHSSNMLITLLTKYIFHLIEVCCLCSDFELLCNWITGIIRVISLEICCSWQKSSAYRLTRISPNSHSPLPSPASSIRLTRRKSSLSMIPFTNNTAWLLCMLTKSSTIWRK